MSTSQKLKLSLLGQLELYKKTNTNVRTEMYLCRWEREIVMRDWTATCATSSHVTRRTSTPRCSASDLTTERSSYREVIKLLVHLLSSHSWRHAGEHARNCEHSFSVTVSKSCVQFNLASYPHPSGKWMVACGLHGDAQVLVIGAVVRLMAAPRVQLFANAGNG